MSIATLNRIVEETDVFYNTKRERDKSYIVDKPKVQHIPRFRWENVISLVKTIFDRNDNVNIKVVNNVCAKYCKPVYRPDKNYYENSLSQRIIKELIKRDYIERVKMGNYKKKPVIV